MQEVEQSQTSSSRGKRRTSRTRVQRNVGRRGASDAEWLRIAREAWLESLELTNYDDDVADLGGDDDDDDDDYVADEPSGGSTAASRGRGRAAAKKAKKAISSQSKSKGRKDKGTSPKNKKQYRLRSLGQVLADADPASRFYVGTLAAPSALPPRQFCAMTGAIAKYREKGSRVGFSSRKSLQGLEEKLPPWARRSALTGATPYFDSIRMLRSLQARQQAAGVGEQRR